MYCSIELVVVKLGVVILWGLDVRNLAKPCLLAGKSRTVPQPWFDDAHHLR